MSEAASIEDVPLVRPRRACRNCYEKKIKCDYDPELGTCTFCQKNKIDCAVPGGEAPKPRKSIRATVEDLEARVLSLEGYQGPWGTISRLPQSNLMSPASDPPRLPPDLSEDVPDMASSRDARAVPLTRGHTSPWSILLSGTDGSNPDHQTFRALTLATAKSESSLTISNESTSYNIFAEIPGLTFSKVYQYASDYACVAPYPVLHWDSLILMVQSLSENNMVLGVGQATCIWIYMAFGAAHIMETRSDTSASSEPGTYFEKAWRLLPRLLLDYDLWALKAVTLMVHYLQASAKPQACWALLGTALRLATSLGFDQNDSDLSIYSNIEQEEGRRAFWLCHIMEKSLCINLGRSSFFTTPPNVPTPQPFVPITTSLEGDILSVNEQDATDFFCEMIALTEVRDQIFAALQSAQTLKDDSYQQILSRLQRTSRSGGLSSGPGTAIRNCIHDLAYHNTVQVLATTQRPARRRHISDEAVTSARKSLDILNESRKNGQLMCLWMWLYYAFTSAVVLFLHSIANIHDHETTLNLAAITDFEDICGRVKDVSEGAAQCMEIARAMRALIYKSAKMAGRKRSREAEDPDEGGSSKRRPQPETVNPAELEQPNPFLWPDSMAADPNEVFAGAPANFAWDEWDKWLEDVNFTDAEGP